MGQIEGQMFKMWTLSKVRLKKCMRLREDLKVSEIKIERPSIKDLNYLLKRIKLEVRYGNDGILF
jgi:hypothetical protein